jgi:hypothetical protein
MEVLRNPDAFDPTRCAVHGADIENFKITMTKFEQNLKEINTKVDTLTSTVDRGMAAIQTEIKNIKSNNLWASNFGTAAISAIISTGVMLIFSLLKH